MPQDIFILKLQNSKQQKQFMIFLILSSLICVCSYLPTLMICMMLKDHPFCIQVRFHREVLIHEQDCLLSYENMCFLMTNLKSSWMDVLPKRPKWTQKNFINQDKRNVIVYSYYQRIAKHQNTSVNVKCLLLFGDVSS